MFDVVGAGIPQGVVATGGKAQTVGSIASVGGEGDGIAFAEDGTHAELVVNELATDEVFSIGKGDLRDPESGVLRRVRGTAGGDRLPVSYNVSTNTASLSLVNILFNATVSEDAIVGTLDLTDFYLGTPFPPHASLKS